MLCIPNDARPHKKKKKNLSLCENPTGIQTWAFLVAAVRPARCHSVFHPIPFLCRLLNAFGLIRSRAVFFFYDSSLCFWPLWRPSAFDSEFSTLSLSFHLVTPPLHSCLHLLMRGTNLENLSTLVGICPLYSPKSFFFFVVVANQDCGAFRPLMGPQPTDDRCLSPGSLSPRVYNLPTARWLWFLH